MPALQPSYRASFGAILAAIAGAALALPANAAAASFAVNDATDAALASPSATSCVSVRSSCTLRAAVQAADNLGGASTITVPAGLYKLTIASTGENDPSTGDLDVKSGVGLTITGAGAGSTILDGNHLDREFAVQSGAVLSLSGATVQHGAQPFLEPSKKSTQPGWGGAFYNNGTLTITNCVIRGQLRRLLRRGHRRRRRRERHHDQRHDHRGKRRR